MKLKRIMAIVLCFAMVLSTMSFNVFAEEGVTENADTVVAKVGDAEFTDIQEAIKAAAPNGTVYIVDDIVVDEWVMIAESLTIGNNNLITLAIDGMTINGDGHTLTINSIESAGNGARLFYDATELNINNLTIKCAEAIGGGIGLKSGVISGVTFDGGTYGVMPQTGDVIIEDCTFKTDGSSIYFEEERDGLLVTGCTFENPDTANIILLRGDIEFINNTIISGRTVNVVSGSPVVTGNDFGNVRFKVYNVATATIEDNTINNLVFHDDTEVKSTFGENTLSAAAQAVLDAADFGTAVAKVGDEEFTDLQEAIKFAAPAGTVELVDDVIVDKWIMISETLSIGSGQIITIPEINGLAIDGKGHSLTVNAVESATNGDRLFYNATNLNVKDLTINYAEGVTGGIGLTSGTISGVTFNGGVGIIPGDGDITITGCTFKTSGSAIYNETVRDNLVVTGNHFETAAGQYAIYLRGNTTFTDNTVVSGRVNVVSGSPVVTGNDFGVERFKVYNVATATIEDNTINNLVFHDDTEVKSTFGVNTLSAEAQAVLDAADFGTAVAKIGNVEYDTLQAAINAANTGDTVTLINNIALTEANLAAGVDKNVLIYVENKDITLDMNGQKISVIHEDPFTNDYIVAVIAVADGAGLTVTGNGTIDVKVLEQNSDIAYMFWKRGTTGHLTIENGTYHMNDSADSMVYTNGNEIVTVKGGTWTLDTYGTRENRAPWIFNVQGAGDNHVIVTGGTYNADINRQHWSNEVLVPETHYTVKNADNTYTVHEGAVAYVNEGMLTGGFFAPKNVGYATLSEAIAAAVERNDSPVVLIKDIINVEEFEINTNTDSSIVLDLNEKTLNGAILPSDGDITVKNGSIVNKNSGVSAIEINSGKLTLENVNIDSARHAVRIDGAVEATINGGTYKSAIGGTATLHAVNASGGATVTIIDGIFVGPKGTTADSGAAVMVQAGTTVTIKGGNYSGGKNNTLAAKENANLTVYGGTFDQDPTTYVADDYFAYNETGAYVVEEEKVSKIGDVKYKTLQDAVDAAQEDDVIVIRNDFVLDTIVTVANGKNITLDLNGKTITGTDNTEKNFSLIDNRGDLTITGNGTMTLTATVNSGWNRYSAVLANNPGGKLTIENGTIEHLGGTDMAYGIDNLTNGKGTYAETIINGGTIKSTYRGIRQFLNGIEAQNILTVNGGTVEGTNKSIWMQDPSKNANTGTLTVGEDANLIGDVYLFVTAGSTEWPVEVSIAKSAVNGEVLSANVPAGYEVVEKNGYYGIENTTASVYAVEAIADKTKVRYNNGNPDSFTVKYVVTGGNVIGAMAQLEYDNTLFICTEDSSDNDGVIRMNSNALTTDANGETVIKELHFTVKKNVDVDTPYTFNAKYVQVVSDYDAAGSGAQDGYVENVIGEEVTVIAQHDVTLDTEGALAGNTYVDADADYSATINNFDENKTYTITYTMDGVEQPAITVTKDNVDNSGFVIENVTGDIVFTSVTSELNFELILLPEAVTGHTLVLVKDGVSAGYKYNDVEMYAVDRYVGLTEIVENTDREEFVAEDGVDILDATSVRAILIEGGVTLDEARAAITVYNKASDSIEKSFDVNRNGKFFFNDAMTAFGCYGKQYDVALELAYYLASDVNTDFMIDTDDYDDTVEAFWATLD